MLEHSLISHTSNNINKTEAVQRRFTKIITGLSSVAYFIVFIT